MLTIKKKIATALAGGIAALGAPDALSEGDLALKCRAKEKSCRIARTIKCKEEQVVPQRADNGRNSNSPYRALQKSEPCRLEPLSLYHHTGL